MQSIRGQLDPLWAAAHLLQQWLPTDPVTGAPAWRLALVPGQAPPSYAEQWSVPPTTAEVTSYGGFPESFPDAGAAGNRYPVAVERFALTPELEACGALRAAEGHPDPGAQRAIELLVDTVESMTGPLDRRSRSLAGFLAGALAEGGTDLLLVSVAAEPGGPRLDGELHLLVRGGGGHVLRLALVPAASLPPVPGSTARGTLESRIACVTVLLSECLWMNNNNQVTFEVTFGSHRVDLNGDATAADAAFRAGWAGEGDWWLADASAEEAGYGLLRLLDGASLAFVLADSERSMVDMARQSAGDRSDTPPEIPGDQLVSWLSRDLLDAVSVGVTGGPGLAPVLAYGAGLPLELAGDGACLLLVGPERTGLIEIDDSF